MAKKNIHDRVKEIINPDIDQYYQKYINDFRHNHIPKRYNQVKMLDELNNPDIDHFISISNRTDGKSFNYIHALLNIAIEFEVGLSFYSRNLMLRHSYQTLIYKIIDKSTILNRKDFNFIRTQYYISLVYKDRTIGIISDLNNAGELKYFSNELLDYPIMIYDEFISLETDYLGDEFERIKTIYESIDRKESFNLIHKPKIFYFGNAMNFESPVLHGLKIFNILEQHPINTAKIYKYQFHVMLEMHRNENANEQRNTRAFASENDAMTTGQFKTNKFMLATDGDRWKVKQNPRTIYVKLRNDYLRIQYNHDDLRYIILSIESRIDDQEYQYNMLLKDNKESSTYLKEKYFTENHIKKIDKGMYLFDNKYSKDYITSDFHELNMLNIPKLIKETMKTENEYTERENKENQFQENYIEQTKKGLIQKMWG